VDRRSEEEGIVNCKVHLRGITRMKQGPIPFRPHGVNTITVSGKKQRGGKIDCEREETKTRKGKGEKSFTGIRGEKRGISNPTG